MFAEMGAIYGASRISICLELMAYAIPLRFAPTDWNCIGWIGVTPLATAIFD
jgi:hypothetical protein